MRLIALVILSLLAAGVAYPAGADARPPVVCSQPDPDAIAHASISMGNRDIACAWLVMPTDRYPHQVRGQAYEAGGLRVVSRQGRVFTLTLEDEFVFEDRVARLADLDGDGRDEIILVLASRELGAALAAYSLAGERLQLKARTPFAGQPFRWLNPAGIADLDGDGRLDVALVQKPHLDKILEVWTLENGGFVRFARVQDVSNHRNGSPFTALSAIADFDGDGIADLAVPAGDLSSLRLFSFARREVRELSVHPLPAPVAGNLMAEKTQSGTDLVIPLQDMGNFRLELTR